MNEQKRKVISLASMDIDQEGIVSCFECGRGFVERLNALNIRCGKRIKKISTTPFHGPIVIEIDNSRIAIGHGMGKKIMVEIESL